MLVTAPLFSAARCEEILQLLTSEPGWRRAGGTAGNTRVLNLPREHIVLSWLRRDLAPVMLNALGGCALVLGEAALVRYCAGAVVPPHTDLNPTKRDRVVSFIVYLTDGFTGGELCIPSCRFKDVCPQGHVVAFPSTERHWAERLAAGDKSVLVGFYVIPSLST